VREPGAHRQPGARRDECGAYVDSAWAWLEGLGTGVRRGDPATWAPPAWPPSYRGVVNTLEVAHADFVWRVRTHARVRQARPRAARGGDGGVAGSACHPDGPIGFLRRHRLLGRCLCSKSCLPSRRACNRCSTLQMILKSLKGLLQPCRRNGLPTPRTWAMRRM